ncbi:putative mitochondrial large ribosomal subunit protein [Neofusicoccum parvum UCRNP2]|uniref:Large ribosomal subunit protein mL49 n=1 Tax=Botryosphaeria parva (strain UCR-NP2) TaxID=1287680 RepID=R1EK08_BOTPV|nr:putative mitochondrial large ribosomal subunit protein [Neofusicoccum parvum UCRNP2]
MAFARPVLPLFRPLATPRPAAITQIHRFSQCARLQQEAQVTTASTTALVDANASAVEQAQQTLLPYFVQRTPSNLLPVYNTAKRGGNLKQTKLRKISGDVKRLRDDLKAYLDLSDKEIVINQLTQNIIAKGNHRLQIIKFLESKKF